MSDTRYRTTTTTKEGDMPKQRIEIELSEETLNSIRGPEMGELRIVVVTGRWNFVGRYSKSDDRVVIRDARCIRRWGTTSGLGELARSGPSDKTKLDHYGTVEFPASQEVLTLACDEAVWS